MKTVIFAYITFISVTATVFINSFVISSYIDDLHRELEETPSKLEYKNDYVRIYENFKNARKYMNFSVSHDDLTGIEADFDEIIGALEAEDEETLIITKSRLIGSLSHLKRLSGINTDSIF